MFIATLLDNEGRNMLPSVAGCLWFILSTVISQLGLMGTLMAIKAKALQWSNVTFTHRTKDAFRFKTKRP